MNGRYKKIVLPTRHGKTDKKECRYANDRRGTVKCENDQRKQYANQDKDQCSLYTYRQNIRLNTSSEQEEHSNNDPSELSISEIASSSQRRMVTTTQSSVTAATLNSTSVPLIILDACADNNTRVKNEDMNSSSTAMKEQNMDAEQRSVYEEQMQAGSQSSCVNNMTDRQVQKNNFTQRDCCPCTNIEHVENVLVSSTASRKSSVVMNEESCILATEASASSVFGRQSANRKNSAGRSLNNYA